MLREDLDHLRVEVCDCLEEGRLVPPVLSIDFCATVNQEADDVGAAYLSGDVQGRAVVVVADGREVLVGAGEERVSETGQVPLSHQAADYHTDKHLLRLLGEIYTVFDTNVRACYAILALEGRRSGEAQTQMVLDGWHVDKEVLFIVFGGFRSSV